MIFISFCKTFPQLGVYSRSGFIFSSILTSKEAKTVKGIEDEEKKQREDQIAKDLFEIEGWRGKNKLTPYPPRYATFLSNLKSGERKTLAEVDAGIKNGQESGKPAPKEEPKPVAKFSSGSTQVSSSKIIKAKDKDVWVVYYILGEKFTGPSSMPAGRYRIRLDEKGMRLKALINNNNEKEITGGEIEEVNIASSGSIKFYSDQHGGLARITVSRIG
jgi:hypothetical protein